MRKVTLKVELEVIAMLDEETEVGEFVSELAFAYPKIVGMDIMDVCRLDYKVIDSK